MQALLGAEFLRNLSTRWAESPTTNEENKNEGINLHRYILCRRETAIEQLFHLAAMMLRASHPLSTEGIESKEIWSTYY